MLYILLNLSVIIPVLGWVACVLVTPVLWYSLIGKFNNMIEDLGKPVLIAGKE